MAFSITPQSRLVLNPGLRLRLDVDRVVLITKPPPLSDLPFILRLLPPTEALILCLFDGQRTVWEVGNLWAELSDKSVEAAHGDVSQVINFYTTGERERERILIKAAKVNLSHVTTYDPMQFIIPADRVNLEERRLRIPYMVYFMPTLYCPHHCIYCYAKRSPKPESNLISVQRLSDIFIELHGMGVEVIQMSGGEVFAHPRFLEVLRAIGNAGMVADIPTKLGLSYDMVLSLRDLGIKIIQFSLDSANPRILDYMVGVPNYHRRAFAALENLRLAGLTVRTNTVLTPVNIPTVGSLLDYLGHLGNVTRVSLSPYGRSLFRHSDEFFVSEDSLQRLEEQVTIKQNCYQHMRITIGDNGAPEPATEKEQRLAWKRRSFCSGNRSGIVILPDGRVTVCEELYDHPAFIIGNLNRQSVMEVWRSPEALALLNPDQTTTPDGPCMTCEQFTQCHIGRGRCWRDVLKSYGWDRPHWPDPRCPQAPSGNRLG